MARAISDRDGSSGSLTRLTDVGQAALPKVGSKGGRSPMPLETMLQDRLINVFVIVALG